MIKKYIFLSPMLAATLLSANTNLQEFSNDKINNLGKGFANLIIKSVPNYQYFTNFDLCYKVVSVDFEKGHRMFYTDILKGINNPTLKDNIITICQVNLQELRTKNNTTIRGTLR